MSASITCASCNRPLRVPEGVLGRPVQCPLCLDEFVAQADPAAEAAARAAEPPARRAARKPELVAARTAEEDAPVVAESVEEGPVWVEPVAEAPPAGGRPDAGGRSFAFPVLVARDPDRALRGRMDGELTDRGLHLRKQRQAPAFAAVGAKARYLGANRLVVTVEGREVELVIEKPWTSTYHLARDVAGYLNGQRAFPERRAYNVPRLLYALPALFVILPFAAIPFGLFTDGCLGAFLWCALAAVLAGACTLVVSQRRLTPRARLIGAGGLVGLGAALCLVAIPLTPSYTVDPSLWRPYAPPEGDFTVLMPGSPVQGGLAMGDWPESYTTVVKSPEISFAVHVAPAPPPVNNPFAFQPVNSANVQAVNDSRNRLQQAYAYGRFWPQSERDLGPYGRACHEMVYRYSPIGDDIGTMTQTVVARVFVADDKAYTLTVAGPRVTADGSDVLKFLNSFQAKASANPGPPQQPAPPAGRQPDSPVGMNGLLAYWSFDNVQGDQVQDESGNGLVGRLHRTTVVNDGARGQALHLNGQASYFDFSDANNLNFPAGGNFTICGWVRTRLKNGVILSDRNARSGAPVIDVRLANGALTAEVRQDGNDRFLAAQLSGPAVDDGAWHHFALTRGRGLVLADNVSLYVDGIRKGSQLNMNAGGAVTTDLRALGAELYWQRHGFAGASSFTGDVDEFCVFDRVLDDGEIRRLAGAGGP